MQDELEGDYEGLGARVETVLILKNGEVVAARDWYHHGDTFKIYSGVDKFHVKKEDVEKLLGRDQFDQFVDP